LLFQFLENCDPYTLTGLSAEYNCLFGISVAIPEIEPGDLHRAYDKGFSFMTIGGKGATYFFVFKRLPKRYFAPNIPRYTSSEAESFAQQFQDYPISGTIKFGSIWEKRKSFCLVATEEAHNETWCWGRIACIGDSIHKVTPNAGAGGNMAIESAAALANSLYSLVHNHTNEKQKIQLPEITRALEAYHNSRKDRVKLLTSDANNFTRIEAFHTLKDTLTAKYLLPNAADYLIDSWSGTLVGAIKLDFLPAPKTSLEVTMPYDLERGIGKGESIWKRILRSLPLLGIWCAAWMSARAVKKGLLPFLKASVSKGFIEEGGVRLAIRETFTGLEGFDAVMKYFVACFMPSLAGLSYSEFAPRSFGFWRS
jgi:hypothetical protein